MQVALKNCICLERFLPTGRATDPYPFWRGRAWRDHLRTLSAMLDGMHLSVEAGGRAHFPKGRRIGGGMTVTKSWFFKASPHQVDRYLQALFEVLNAGQLRRPRILYMAHVLHRHRKTQLALVVPPVVQRVLFPFIILLGRLLGKYRGTTWPGCPTRCSGAPLASAD